MAKNVGEEAMDEDNKSLEDPCVEYVHSDTGIQVQSIYQGSQYVRMYGFFFGNSQKCTELGIRISVHVDFNPCTDKCKSVHGNPYIRTFYGDYCIKMAFFLPFFRIFFYLLPIFSKFSRFAQIYNIYSMISNEFLII